MSLWPATRGAWPLAVLVLSTLVVTPTLSETLPRALASAYRSNPQILAQRKAVEATDEGVSQARAGFRPRVVGRADASHQSVRSDPRLLGDGSNKPRGYEIEISQSVFSGFRTVNAMRSAEASVLAARETLRKTEQDVLLNAVTAYMDVIRDRALIKLRENNVRVLSRELKAARDRFRLGDVSRTDVAQSLARRAGAVSALDLAKANLRTSRASYQRFVGHRPGSLTAPGPARRNMPDTLNAGIRQAMEESPDVVAAAFREKAAEHNVDQITGELLPTVDIEASYSNRLAPSPFIKQRETAEIMGRLNIPFYQGGEVYSRVRQARRTREQRGQEIESERREARATLIAGWSSWQAAKAQLRSDRVQVQANQTALKGVRIEERVGQRTILDVLDAEQELFTARSSLVSTQRDVVVSSYRVLAAVGRLTAADLRLNLDLHDPEIHYGAVRRKAWGTRVTREEPQDDTVVSGWDAVPDADGDLLEDVTRMTGEAAAFVRNEVARDADEGVAALRSSIEDVTEALRPSQVPDEPAAALRPSF